MDIKIDIISVFLRIVVRKSAYKLSCFFYKRLNRAVLYLQKLTALAVVHNKRLGLDRYNRAVAARNLKTVCLLKGFYVALLTAAA